MSHQQNNLDKLDGLGYYPHLVSDNHGFYQIIFRNENCAYLETGLNELDSYGNHTRDRTGSLQNEFNTERHGHYPDFHSSLEFHGCDYFAIFHENPRIRTVNLLPVTDAIGREGQIYSSVFDKDCVW